MDRIDVSVSPQAPFDTQQWAADIADTLDRHLANDIPASWPDRRRLLANLLRQLDIDLGRYPRIGAALFKSDLRILLLALSDLDAGGKSPHPLVAPATGLQTIAGASQMGRWFRINVIALADIMRSAGYSSGEAYRLIANELTVAGFRGLKADPSDPEKWEFRPATIKRWDMAARQHPWAPDSILLDRLVQDIVNRNPPWPPTKEVAIEMVRAVATSDKLASLKPEKRQEVR